MPFESLLPGLLFVPPSPRLVRKNTERTRLKNPGQTLETAPISIANWAYSSFHSLSSLPSRKKIWPRQQFRAERFETALRSYSRVMPLRPIAQLRPRGHHGPRRIDSTSYPCTCNRRIHMKTVCNQWHKDHHRQCHK